MAKTYEQFKNEVLGKGFDIDGAYGAQCLESSTLVHMVDGSLLPVEELKVGDVLEGGNIVVSNEKKQSELIEVKTDCGRFIVTPDHRFIGADDNEIEELKVGDRIMLNNSEIENDLNLTPDELRFLGFYMGDGTKKYRWKNTTKPEIFITVGTDKKLEYLKSLKIHHRKIALHSNKKAKLFYLKNSEHKELMQLIHSIDGKKLPLIFTKEQYRYIIEGYLNADGHGKRDSFVASSVTKELLVSIQHGCILNGWRAILSKPTIRKTNFCDHPKPIYRLTINKNRKPTGKILSIESVPNGNVNVLNTDGDHTYYAENHKHHNCWDGAMYYSQWLGYPVFNCTVTGYVQDIWTQRKTSGILNYYDEVELLQPGDIVVFKVHPSTPLSHIAIFDHDLGNGQGAFLGQNQGAPGMAFNIIPLPYDATYQTAFRPKCFSGSQSKPNTPEKPSDGLLYGLDLSEHNGSVNFSRVAQTNDFVVLRAGFGWSTDQKDKRFEEYYQQAKAHNLRVGAYWYTYARNLDEAKKEAECFKEITKGKEFDFGVWVDLEDADHWKANNGNPSGAMQAQCANLIMDEMKKAGYQVGIYASTYPIDHEYKGLDITNYPLWEANYNINDGNRHGDFSHRAVLHQYTSLWRLDGKNYDRNVCYKDIFKDGAKAPKKGAEGSVYRLYNPNTGDHLYTTSYLEAMGVYMAGWNYEGIAWVSPKDGDPVYRLLNPNDGTHAFGPEAEKDGLLKLGWKLEGVAFYSGGSKPIYRMYNPNNGAHVLTADIKEHNGLTKLGWTCEGQELKY